MFIRHQANSTPQPNLEYVDIVREAHRHQHGNSTTSPTYVMFVHRHQPNSTTCATYIGSIGAVYHHHEPNSTTRSIYRLLLNPKPRPGALPMAWVWVCLPPYPSTPFLLPDSVTIVIEAIVAAVGNCEA